LGGSFLARAGVEVTKQKLLKIKVAGNKQIYLEWDLRFYLGHIGAGHEKLAPWIQKS
jgi:hypothetical protein